MNKIKCSLQTQQQQQFVQFLKQHKILKEYLLNTRRYNSKTKQIIRLFNPLYDVENPKLYIINDFPWIDTKETSFFWHNIYHKWLTYIE